VTKNLCYQDTSFICECFLSEHYQMLWYQRGTHVCNTDRQCCALYIYKLVFWFLCHWTSLYY